METKAEDITASEHQQVSYTKPEHHDPNAIGIDVALLAGVAANTEDFETLVREANEANDEERSMSVTQALKTYPKAIAWSFVLSTAIIMEGYDTAVIGSFWAYPPFLEIFGVRGKDNELRIPAPWQNGISSGTSVGQIIGLQIAGWAANRFGYRWTIIPALFVLIGFIFIPFFAKSLTVLLVGEILQGLSWGVFQTMTITYAAEVAPVAIRHWLTSWVNTCWFIGQFISAGVLRGLLSRTDIWGYRIPFAIQWIWPVPIIIGTLLAPESPWYFVKTGQVDKARRSLARLARTGSSGQRHVDRQLALLVYTNEVEKAQSEGVSYLDCFRGVELRRTEITCMCFIAQTMCGSALGGLQSFFYTSAGISTTSAYDLGLGQTAIGIVGTLSSWLILARVGRRTLFLSGMVLIFFLLIIVGALGIPSQLNQAESWAAGTMVLLISTVYGFSIGPVVYNLVGELPSTRVRAKSVVLARNCYNITNVAFVNIVTYRQLSADEWGWGSKAGFFWAGSNLLFTIYLYFRLPETKGRTYIDLDILFENKIPARKFASTKIENIT